MNLAQAVPNHIREQRIERIERLRRTEKQATSTHPFLPPKVRIAGRDLRPCTREQCRTCDRQFLDSDARTLLKSHNDYRYLSEKDAERTITKLGNAIEDAWDRIKVCAKPAFDLIPTMDDTIKDLYQVAFPNLLTYRQHHYVRCKRPDGIVSLPQLSDGLKVGRFYLDLCEFDSQLKDTVAYLKSRFAYPPSQSVYAHSDFIQLGWESLLFDFSFSHVFIDLNHQSYRDARLSHPVELGALHKDRVFSFERGLLILQSQELYYSGVADFLEAVNQYGQSLEPKISATTSALEVLTAHSTMRSMLIWIDDVLPRVQMLLKTQQDEYGRFKQRWEDNVVEIDAILKWVRDGQDCPSDAMALEHAISAHVFSAMDLLSALHNLLNALRHFRSVLKGWARKVSSKIKIHAARDRVECALFTYIKTIASSFLRNHQSVSLACEELVELHNGDYKTLMRCDRDHLCRGDTRDFWTMYGLIEAHAPVSLILSGCLEVLGTQRDMFRAGVKEKLKPHLDTARSIFSALSQMGPCCDPVQQDKTSVDLLKLATYDSLAGAVVAAMKHVSSPELKDNYPKRWSELMWSIVFCCLESSWSRDKTDEEERANQRHVFGMERQKRRPKSDSSEEGSNGKEGATQQDLGVDADTVEAGLPKESEAGKEVKTGIARGSSKKRDAQKPVKAQLFNSHDSPCNHGISENLRWEMEWTPRPSQFGDDDLASQIPRKTKRRDIVLGSVPEEGIDVAGQVQLPLIVAPVPNQPLVFTDAANYESWRNVFPHPNEHGGSRSRMRWNELRRVLIEPPLRFVEDDVTGDNEHKWRRMAGDGYDETMVAMHKPHGSGKVWLERAHLQTIQARFRHSFGWSYGDFVLRE